MQCFLAPPETRLFAILNFIFNTQMLSVEFSCEKSVNCMLVISDLILCRFNTNLGCQNKCNLLALHLYKTFVFISLQCFNTSFFNTKISWNLVVKSELIACDSCHCHPRRGCGHIYCHLLHESSCMTLRSYAYVASDTCDTRGSILHVTHSRS